MDKKPILSCPALVFFGIPTFEILWKNDKSIKEPTAIPTTSLFPNIIEPVCAPSAGQTAVSCDATFESLNLAHLERRSVFCPPGCLSTFPKVASAYGDSGCYALHSSVCTAAVHSGVLPEQGGVAVIMVDHEQNKGHYGGSEGFLLASNDAPAAIGCGSIQTLDSEGGPSGIVQLRTITEDMLERGDTELTPVSGMSGVLSNSGKTLLFKKGFDKLRVQELRLSCGGQQRIGVLDKSEYEDEIPIENGVSVLVKMSSLHESGPIADAYITYDEMEKGSEEGNSFLSAAGPQLLGTVLVPTTNGHSRQTCTTEKTTVHLYVQHVQEGHQYSYPSRTLECDSIFKDLQLDALKAFVTVRCPRKCFKNFAPVYGTFSYTSDSSICRSAIHSGSISNAGGVVSVTRRTLPTPKILATHKNGIQSSSKAIDSADSVRGLQTVYSVTAPSGKLCHYPQHTHLAKLSMGMPKLALETSFIQLDSESSWGGRVPPPVRQVSFSTATSPDRLQHLEQQSWHSGAVLHDHTADDKVKSKTPSSLISRAAPTSFSRLNPAGVKSEGIVDSSAFFTGLLRSQYVPHQGEAANSTANFRMLSEHELSAEVARFGNLISSTSGEVDQLQTQLSELRKLQLRKQNDTQAIQSDIYFTQFLISSHLKKMEMEIEQMERELYSQVPQASAVFNDFDRTYFVEDDWLPVDAVDALGGPSVWEIEHPNLGKVIGDKFSEIALTQKRAISSKLGLGTIVLLKGKQYTEGFLTCRVQVPPGRYGTVGIIVKAVDSNNFTVLEVIQPSSAATTGSQAQFRQMLDGRMSAPQGRISIDSIVGWVPISVDFTDTHVHADISSGKFQIDTVLAGFVRGGSIGFATNAIGQDTKVAFDSIVAGPADMKTHYAPSFALSVPKHHLDGGASDLPEDPEDEKAEEELTLPIIHEDS